MYGWSAVLFYPGRAYNSSIIACGSNYSETSNDGSNCDTSSCKHDSLKKKRVGGKGEDKTMHDQGLACQNSTSTLDAGAATLGEARKAITFLLELCIDKGRHYFLFGRKQTETICLALLCLAGKVQGLGDKAESGVHKRCVLLPRL